MKIVKKLLFGLFLVISLTYLFIVITPKIFKNFYPFGIRVAVVLTGSMEPTLNINDFVIIKKPVSFEVGDIISYQSSDTKNDVMHRVISINGDEIQTRGDANNTVDAPIDRSQVTGVYVGKIKYVGKVISFFTSPFGFGLIVVFLMVIVLLPTKIKK